MADALVRLRVESQEYDSKIRRAVEGLKHMKNECRRVGGTLEIVEQNELDFVRALGQMDTQAENSKQQMREFTNAINDLIIQYGDLTKEEQNSPFGKAMAASIDQLKARAGDLKDQLMDTEAEIRQLGSDTKVFDEIAGGVGLVVSSFQLAQGAIQMFGVDSEEAAQAIAKLQGAMAVTNSLTQIQNALQRQSALMIGVTTLQRKAATVAENLNTAAKSGNIVVTKAATVAQRAMNAAANANPYVLLASAVIAVGTALYMFIKRTQEATEEEKKAAEEARQAQDKMREEAERTSQTIGNKVGDVVSKYKILQAEYLNLKTQQEKTKWIDDNANAFKELGKEIKSAADADQFFINSSKQVVAALTARSIAEGYKDLIRQKSQEIASAESNKMVTWAKAQKGDSVEDYTGDEQEYLQKKFGSGALGSTWVDHRGISYIYFPATEEVAKATNDYRFKKASEKRSQDIKDKNDNLAAICAEMIEKQNTANELIKAAGLDFDTTGSTPTSTTNPTTSTSTTKPTTSSSSTNDTFRFGDYREATKEGTLANLKWRKSLIQNSMEMAETSDDYAEMAAELERVNALIDEFTGATKEADEEMTNAQKATGLLASARKQLLQGTGSQETYLDALTASNLQQIVDSKGLLIDIPLGVEVPDEQWEQIVEQINDQLKKLGIEPIKIDVETGGIETLKKEVAGTIDHVNGAASSFQALGSAMGSIKDPGAKVAGLVAQAIGSIVAGYGSASMQASSMGPWAWITFVISGLATMISTVASIKSATAGSYAEGGIIPGTSFSGDNLTANVNSGELILNRAQQASIAGQLQQGSSINNGTLSTRIKGGDILIALDNTNRSRGGSRGTYAYSK